MQMIKQKDYCIFLSNYTEITQGVLDFHSKGCFIQNVDVLTHLAKVSSFINSFRMQIFSVSGNTYIRHAIISNSQIINANVGAGTARILLLFGSCNTIEADQLQSSSRLIAVDALTGCINALEVFLQMAFYCYHSTHYLK